MTNDPQEKTNSFSPISVESHAVRQTIKTVHKALKEKGYHPVNQLVGYLISGDPTYITSHLKARNVIQQADRHQLLEEIVRFYLRGL